VRLDWLELRDFRSYRDLHLEPDPGVNVLVGDNGAGKTNVLEAISYLSALRSFRRAPDEALVRDGAGEAIVRGGFSRSSGEVRVEVQIRLEGRRSVLLNGKRPSRHAAVAAEVPLVSFLPDDLDMVKRGPALRREYLDDLAAQLAPAAGADRAEYDKALRQRNALLRRDGRDTDPLTLDVWDRRLAEAAGKVLEHRLTLLERLVPWIENAYRTVGDDTAVLRPTYVAKWAEVPPVGSGRVPAAGELAEALVVALGERRRRDLEQRTTTAGAHRDEPGFELDGMAVRTRASQGEQRSVALSMRLAAYHMLEDRHGRPPILLLDDVFSELDLSRVSGVMELLPRGQVFVTTARDDDVAVEGRRWMVEGGRLT
jgi:DNA replication and repair protein RecF